jgi:hypothetical protein
LASRGLGDNDDMIDAFLGAEDFLGGDPGDDPEDDDTAPRAEDFVGVDRDDDDDDDDIIIIIDALLEAWRAED